MSHSPATEYDAQGYLLLTLPDEYAGSRNLLASGEMRLECVSLPVDPSIGQRANPFADSSDPTKDLWLVVQVGTFELPLLPTQKVTIVPTPSTPSSATPSPGSGSTPPIPPKSSSLAGKPISTLKSGLTFSIPSASGNSSASILLTLPPATSAEDEEDFETFQVLLKQYGCLSLEGVSREVKSTAVIVDVTSPAGPELSSQTTTTSTAPTAGGLLPSGSTSTSSSLAPPGSRPGLASRPSQGRFILVDENSGKVIGELDQSLTQERDEELAKNSDAVVVDFGTLSEGWNNEVTVKTIDEKQMEGDWLLKGAHYLSKGILSFGSNYKAGVHSAADYVIKNTTPAAEPVHFHPAAKESIRQVHNVSATGLKVTKKTMGAVNNAIGKVIEKTAEVGTTEYNYLKGEFDTRSASRRASFNPEGLEKPRRNSLNAEANDAFVSSEPDLSNPSSGTASPLQKASIDGISSPPAYTEKRDPSGLLPPPQRNPSGPRPSIPEKPPIKDQAKGFLRRLMVAAEAVGTSLEATGSTLITSTTDAASDAAGHKFGPDARQATQLLGGSVRNVALVYVDIRGVGRNTLIGGARKGATGVIKARLADGTEVTLAQPVEGESTIQMVDGSQAQEAQGLVMGLEGVKVDEGGKSVDALKKDV